MFRKSIRIILRKKEISLVYKSLHRPKTISSNFYNNKKILINHNLNYTQVRYLNENEYEKKVNQVLESINDCFEDLLENQTKISNYDINLSDGVLTINLDSFGTYVLNKQTPNKQIWISSPLSGPKRYDFENGVWIYKHDNLTLHELLNHEIGSFLDLGNIDFTNCLDGKNK